MQIYESLINDIITPTMNGRGFTRDTKESMIFRDNDLCQLLSFGVSKSRGNQQLYVAVGTGFKSLVKWVVDFKQFSAPSSRKPNIMSTDLGHAVGNQYKEWDLQKDTNIGNEISNMLTSAVDHWFMKYRTVADLIDSWERGETYNLGQNSLIYIISYKWYNDKKESALELLRNEIDKSLASSSRANHRFADILKLLQIHLIENTGPTR